MSLRVAAALLLVAGLAEAALAQQAIIVQRNVNLRRDPSTGQLPIMLLLPPEELELLDSVRTNNYYHVVRHESADTGWVWGNNVRRVVLTDSGVVPTGVALAIDSTWLKPALTVGTFRSPVRDSTCGPVGIGGDSATNRHKNRTDTATTYRAVAFDAIGDLEYPATSSRNRTAWPAESLVVIRRYEGVPVSITGFLVALKVQSGGSGETTNCGMTRTAEVDWHMAIVEHPGEGEEESIVVETTPRVRVNHPGWTATRLRPWVDSSDSVRVSGWLMFDPQHRDHIGRYRKTLWEIHPVMRIDVWRNGEWVRLDDIP